MTTSNSNGHFCKVSSIIEISKAIVHHTFLCYVTIHSCFITCENSFVILSNGGIVDIVLVVSVVVSTVHVLCTEEYGGKKFFSTNHKVDLNYSLTVYICTLITP